MNTKQQIATAALAAMFVSAVTFMLANAESEQSAAHRTACKAWRTGWSCAPAAKAAGFAVATPAPAALHKVTSLASN